MPTRKPTNVPVGVTTVVGYTATFTAAATAVLAYIFADADQQTLGTIAAGVVALGSLLVTQIGRYAQARELAKAAAPASPSQQAVAVVADVDVEEQPETPGDDPPPEAVTVPLTDPSTIPPDEGDAEAEAEGKVRYE
jgi:hypothetical protein